MMANSIFNQPIFYNGHYTYDFTELDDIQWKYVCRKHGAKECVNLQALDVENSNGFYDPRTGKVHGFNHKKYERNHWYRYMIDQICLPVSLVYIWQYAIEDATGEIKVFLGRTEEEYYEFREHLSRCIRMYANVPAKSNVYAFTYVHNLSHEFNVFLRNIEHLYYDKSFSVFARDVRKPIYARHKEFKVSWEYRCSYFLTNRSLRQWAKDEKLPVQKEESIDYLKIHTPNEPLDPDVVRYSVIDTVVMIYGLDIFRKEYGPSISNIPLTSTGRIRRILQQKAIENPDYASMCYNLQQSLSFDMFLKLIHCYSGGWTHGNSRYVGEKVRAFERKSRKDIEYQLGGLDITSSYPATCCNYSGFPVTPFEKWDVSNFAQLEKEDVEHPQHAFFFKVTLYDITASTNNTLLSLSKTIEADTTNARIDNGRIEYIKKASFYLTNVDWFAVTRSYYIGSYEIEELYVADAGYLPKPLVETILNAYADKVNLTGLGPEYASRRAQAKRIVNGIYGLMVYKFLSTIVEYKDGEWSHWFPSPENGGNEYYDEEMSDINPETCHTYYPWGIWVTAVSRNLRLWAGILPGGHYNSLPLGGLDERLLYADTDSLKAKYRQSDLEWLNAYNKHIDEENERAAKHFGFDPALYSPSTQKGEMKPLGHFAFDTDDIDPEYLDPAKPFNHYLDFCTLGAKRYADTTVDGVMHTTIAGLPKKSGTKVIKKIDDFNDDTVWDTKQSGKLIVCYKEMPEMDWVGVGGYKYHSVSRYGVCMKPTTFSMSIIPEFKAFLAYINGIADEEYIDENAVMLS